MTTVTCPGCQVNLKVPDAMAGKKAKCNKCGTVFQVPAGEAAFSERPAAAGAVSRRASEALDDLAPRPRKTRADTPDDDFEESDRPRRRGQGKKKKGAPVVLFLCLGIGLFLVLGITVGAVAYFMLRGGGRPDGMKWLPTDTHFISVNRVDQMLKSAAWEQLKREVPDMQRQLDMVNKELPIEHISTITVGGTMTQNGDNMVMIVETNRDYKADDLLVKRQGFQQKSAGPHTIYENFSDAMAVVDSRTILYGKKAGVRAVLERNSAATVPARLEAAMKDLNLSKPHWAVIDLGPAMAMMPAGGNLGMAGVPPELAKFVDLPRQLETVGFEMDYGNEMSLKVVIGCKNDSAAEQVVNLVTLGKSMGAIFLADQKDLAKSLGSVQASNAGKKATITGSISVTTIAQAARRAGPDMMFPLGGGGFGPPPNNPPGFPGGNPPGFPGGNPPGGIPPGGIPPGGIPPGGIPPGGIPPGGIPPGGNPKGFPPGGKPGGIVPPGGKQPFKQGGGAGAAIMNVQGTLALSDPFDRARAQCHHKTHLIRLTAGKLYVFDMMSGYDNFLRLETAGGLEVAQDDDSGEGLNARMTYRAAQSGDYRIIATTCFPGNTGPYSLTVREQ